MAEDKVTLQSIPQLVDREQITGSVLGHYVRSLWKSALLILVLSSLFVVYLLIKPGGPKLMIVGDNIIQGLLETVGLLLTLPLSMPRTGQGGRVLAPFAERLALGRTPQRWVPLLLGLGILSYIVGQALWTYNENIAHLTVLFPTWADAGYLGSYPFILFALLLLPTHPLTADTRTRILLDSLMIMVGVTTFSWYFILGPTILQTADTVLSRIISTAYPLATLVLIFCLLLLVLQSHDRAIRPAALILGLAFAVIVVTDSIYGYQELHTMYVTGSLLDVFWPLGYMLVGLGTRALRVGMHSRYLFARTSAESDPSGETTAKLLSSVSLWKAMLPYLFIPVVILLLAYTMSVSRNGVLRMGVGFGTTVLIMLLIVRQFLIIRETRSHYQKLWEMREQVIEAELAREKAERLKVERILALNQALTSSQQSEPHTRILALGHYQVRDSEGIYYNVYHREGGEHQTFECECHAFQRMGICTHSLTIAALHTASETP